jgi:hypothetical protein
MNFKYWTSGNISRTFKAFAFSLRYILCYISVTVFMFTFCVGFLSPWFRDSLEIILWEGKHVGVHGPIQTIRNVPNTGCIICWLLYQMLKWLNSKKLKKPTFIFHKFVVLNTCQYCHCWLVPFLKHCLLQSTNYVYITFVRYNLKFFAVSSHSYLFRYKQQFTHIVLT